MPKIYYALIILIVILGGIFLYLTYFSGNKNINQDSNAKQIAQEWIITKSPTYTFDGRDLQFQDSIEDQGGTQFIFTFTSLHGGFGNRQDQIITQVLTPHTIVVLVKNNQVVSAITDNQFDELNNQPFQ